MTESAIDVLAEGTETTEKETNHLRSLTTLAAIPRFGTTTNHISESFWTHTHPLVGGRIQHFLQGR